MVNRCSGVVEGSRIDHLSAVQTPAVAITPAVPDDSGRVVSSEHTLVAMFAIALLVMFAAPTRLFFVPFTYQGTYITVIPPNLLDAVWMMVGLALYMRAGKPSAKAPLAAAGLMILGAVAITLTNADVPERVLDLVTFNARLVGGVMVGVLAARAGIESGLLGSLLMSGTLIVALSTVYLGLVGGAQYDFYAQMQRYGGMGISPNEAGIMFAAALNMLPLLFERRPWLGLFAPVLLSALLMTGSRTGVLLLVPGLLFWIPALVRVARVGGGRAVVGSMVMTTLVAMLGIWLMSQGAAESVAPVAARLETTADVSNIGRLEIYLGVPYILAFREPLILLVGAGGSNAAVEWFLKEVAQIWTSHTHNLVLQFLTAYGLVGLVVAWVFIKPLLRPRRCFPNAESLGLRWFGLTMVGGQAAQYGMWEIKFLVALTLVVGYVAVIAPRNREGVQ